MSRRFGFWLGNLIVTAAFIFGAVWVVLYRQEVIDWWRLQSYDPPAEVLSLAQNTTMQGRGRDLFYVSEPEIQDKQAFNANCYNGQGEQTIVLGCYRAQRIYIYNVNDERLAGVKEVTAAHEMLHAAYERLNGADRRRINSLLQSQIDTNADPRIAGLIALYNKEEPGQLYNEMHSILPTEVAQLSPELEEYYRQYFSDRQKIVGYSQNYEAILSGSKQRISMLEAQLSDLKEQIDAQNTTLQAQEAALQAQSDQMNAWRAQGQIAPYNAAVPGYNRQVQDFNALVEKTKADVAAYNQLVEQHNQEAAAQSDLYKSLNSNYQPIQTN